MFYVVFVGTVYLVHILVIKLLILLDDYINLLGLAVSTVCACKSSRSSCFDSQYTFWITL